MTSPTQPSTGDQSARALLTVVLGQALLIGGFLLWAYGQPEHNAGDTCEGIGFGCVPSLRDSARIVGMLVGVPLLTVSSVVATVVATQLARRSGQPGLGTGIIGWLIGWTVAGCGGLAVLAFVKLH